MAGRRSACRYDEELESRHTTQERIGGEVSLSGLNSAGAAKLVTRIQLTEFLNCDLVDSGRLHMSSDGQRCDRSCASLIHKHGGCPPFSTMEPILLIFSWSLSLIHPLPSPELSHLEDLNLYTSAGSVLTQHIDKNFYPV